MEDAQSTPVESKSESKQIVKKKKTRYFETYISKVLKQVSTDNGITANAKQQLNSALCIIARHLSRWAIRLTRISKKKTLSEKEVSNAVKIVFPGEIGQNSIKEGDDSMLRFVSGGECKNTSRQDKAGIIFPPSITEKFLREFGFAKIMVTKNAPIYLAAVLEYITQDILQLASYTSKDNKHVRITIRDLELSVRTDPELSVIFERCRISFIGGGVVPYIHESLLVKKPRKKKKIDVPVTDIGKKRHRFRPGTVTIRDIRKFQKISNCLIFAKHPFERYTRQIISEYSKDSMKISKEVFIVLQYYIEQFIIRLLRDANAAAVHCNRVKLMPPDIRFICQLRGYNIHEQPSEQQEFVDDIINETNDLEQSLPSLQSLDEDLDEEENKGDIDS